MSLKTNFSRIWTAFLRFMGGLAQLAEPNATRIWQSKRTDLGLWAVGAATTAFFWFQIPPPGVSIAVLAVVAAVMTLRDMKNTQRLLAFGLIILLLLVEVRAIERDRGTQEHQHFLDQQALQKSFSEVVKENQDSFKATEQHFAAVVNKESVIYNDITGGASFPYVAPAKQSQTGIPLDVWAQGTTPLTGVDVEIYTFSDFFSQDSISQNISVGTIPSASYRSLHVFLKPTVDEDGIASYLIFMYAENGVATEILQFKRTGTYWISSYRVSRTNCLDVPTGSQCFSQPLLKDVPWPKAAKPEP